VRAKAAVFKQTGLRLLKLTVGRALTTMVAVALSVQLLVLVYTYLMLWVPAPAVAGLKLPLLTPVPEYVPPEGLPPVSVNGLASIHLAV
jgi:hypothetical protein